ncbi:MAG: hypothetical protein U0075_04855 [Thermomicrobiales bacterium]
MDPSSTPHLLQHELVERAGPKSTLPEVIRGRILCAPWNRRRATHEIRRSLAMRLAVELYAGTARW